MMTSLLTMFKITILAVVIILFAPGLPPHDIKFEAWSVDPPSPLEGPLTKNSILDAATPMKLNRQINGPESIAIRKRQDGDEIYTGILGGELIRIKNGNVTVVAKFGTDCDGEWDGVNCGRIAGLRFDRQGTLIAADCFKGIFRVDVDTGHVQQLVRMDVPIEGKLPHYPDDLDIGKDGSIYWSDGSTVANHDENLLEILGQPSGRLVKYDPKTQTNTVLLNRLHFANGVQLSPNEDFVLVADLVQARVLRYYLKGNKQGSFDVFIDKLPGRPDNIRRNEKNNGYYIMLILPRLPGEVDLVGVLGPWPLVRKFMLRSILLVTNSLKWIQSNLWPSAGLREWIIYIDNLGPIGSLENVPKKVTIVETNEDGDTVRSLQSDKGSIFCISEINVGAEFTYFGSPATKGLYRMKTMNLNDSN